MSNPNNNMNAYKQALEINRKLKRENDSLTDSNNNLNEIVSNFLDRMNELEDKNDKLKERIDKAFTIDEIKEARTDLSWLFKLSSSDLIEELEQRLK